MIQTWVTYEVVKIIYLYGLNPEPITTLSEFAPELYTYIQHVKNPTNSTLDSALNVHTTLFNKTSHSSYFLRCKFTEAERIVWKDDVKFIIPFIILSWLRHLEQGFSDKSSTKTWSTLGNYTPVDKLLSGDGGDPLSLVYLSKHDKPNKIKKVTAYRDIIPDETYESTEENYTIKSLEMWAMMCLQTPVQDKLLEAAKVDKETKKRHETCKMLRQKDYKFCITTTNFTKSSKRSRKRKIDEDELSPNPTKTKKRKKTKQSKTTQSSKTDDTGAKHLKPSHNNTNKNVSEHSNNLDYANKTTHELHSMVTQGLDDIEKLFTNVTQEMDMTTNSTTLASLLKTVQEASNAIANITLKLELEETAGMTLDNQKED